MRVLWFNWRDIKNPESGGAEVFTHEVMRRLIIKGYKMTLFTSEYENGLQNEELDGVNIIRNGNRYSVYKRATEYYHKHKDEYDLVIDEINAKPFLAPKFVKDKPVLAILHQLMREIWFYELKFPLSYIAYYYLEKKWLSYYRDVPIITVSRSSMEDLESLGCRKLLMVPQGLSVQPLLALPPKEIDPTIVFIARLKKHKRPDHAVRAFSLIKKEIPSAKFWVIGDGYLRKKLEKLNFKDVIWYGHVNSELKYKLLSRAHLALVPSVREGWGLVVTECNAMGTPVVAYNVPGLRDSVMDGETGILVEDESASALAQSAIPLLRDATLLNAFSNKALAFSRKFTWDNTANEFDNIIRNLVKTPLVH
jgi:glycosyltransferase involved in cell wall biosynthesis